MTRLAFVLAFLIPTAAVFGAWSQGVRHTLSNDPGWVSIKASLERGVMGSVAYLTTPMALADDRLNTGPWHGYQQLQTAGALALSRLQLSVEIPTGSRLDILYANQGVRLSREEGYRSRHFTRDADGRFLTTARLDLDEVPAGPLSVDLRFSPHATELTLAGGPAVTLPPAPPGPWPIGLRGGMHAAYVDEVRATAPDGATAFVDTFEVRTSWLASTLIAALLLTLLTGALVLAARRPRDRLAVRTNAILLTLLIVGTTGWLADRAVLQRFHGYSTLIFKIRSRLPGGVGATTTIETAAQARERLRAEATDSPTDATRVLFLGTSQTWGAGARHYDTQLVSRIADRLNADGADRRSEHRYALWNTGISGEHAGPLVASYIADWAGWRPHLTVVDLGNNDEETAPLDDALRRLVDFNRNRGIRTAFVLEANAPGSPRTTLGASHQLMRALASELDVPVIDLHGYMRTVRESGFV